MSIANEAIEFLAREGVGEVGTTLFSDEMPPDPAECVVVTDYPGRAPEYVLGQALPSIEYYRAQVRARGATKAAGRVLIRNAYNAFAVVRNQDVGTEFWLSALPQQQPARLTTDEKRRTIYVFNVEIAKRR